MNNSPFRLPWYERWLGGHLSLWRVTIYGFNAMHVAINIRMFGGFLCFHPPMWCFGKWWRWYLYFSPNATPQHSVWGFGGGMNE